MAFLFGAGTTDKIDVGALAARTQFSIFVRLKITTAGGSATDRIFLSDRNAGNGRVNWQIGFNVALSDDRVNLFFTHSVAQPHPALAWVTGWSAGSTHTLVGTYDQATMRIFADTDATAKATLAATSAPDPGGVALIGNLDTVPWSADAVIYEAGVWSTALTGAQCAQIGAADASGLPTPDHYWGLVADALDRFGGRMGPSRALPSSRMRAPASTLPRAGTSRSSASDLECARGRVLLVLDRSRPALRARPVAARRAGDRDRHPVAAPPSAADGGYVTIVARRAVPVLNDLPGTRDGAVEPEDGKDIRWLLGGAGAAESAPLKLFMALPNYGHQRFNTISIIHAVTEPGPFDAILPEEHPGSLLAYGFNLLWVRALEERQHGCTHFLMLHADVVPIERDWLARLHQEMVTHDAQVLSAVIPLKDPCGLTSTAFYTEGGALRRLTMTEAMARPETFTAPDLLVNTGLLGRPARALGRGDLLHGHRPHPEARGRLVCRPRLGRGVRFSLQARRLGIPLWATRAVHLSHAGLSWFPNFQAWGTVTHDDGRTWTARHHGVGWTSPRPRVEAMGP